MGLECVGFPVLSASLAAWVGPHFGGHILAGYPNGPIGPVLFNDLHLFSDPHHGGIDLKMFRTCARFWTRWALPYPLAVGAFVGLAGGLLGGITSDQKNCSQQAALFRQAVVGGVTGGLSAVGAHYAASWIGIALASTGTGKPLFSESYFLVPIILSMGGAVCSMIFLG